MSGRPVRREKHIKEGGAGLHIGNSSGSVGSHSHMFSGGSGGSRPTRFGLILLIVIVCVLAASRFGSNQEESTGITPGEYGSQFSSGTYGSWINGDSNTGSLNTSVADGSREKRTQLKGSGDTATVMVYMCGSNLESRSGMASNDIKEMESADFGSDVNVIIYTGGCSQWKTDGIRSDVNQIYEIRDGSLHCLADDMGSKSMTSPDTLSEFIRWAAEKYPADRYELILWDHGGGSISGFGSDENYTEEGSMTLAGISEALQDGGVSFDFIGFDACLMATAETAMVTEPYADYLIASEETEPGIGWYYTDWLNQLGDNPSVSTLELGKTIIDSYTETCSQKCPGQSTTLSLTDLAEFAGTVPSALTGFAADTTSLIRSGDYEKVSDARSGTREFAAGYGIDQIDLVHLSRRLNTDASDSLAQALLSAIKYNRTSEDMMNSYGLSIYFPYKDVSNVDEMVDMYEEIGMDSDYSRCIQEFASLEVSGQIVAQDSGYGSLFGSLFGTDSGNDTYDASAEAIAGLLEAYLNSDRTGLDGLNADNSRFLTDTLDTENAAGYLADNRFDASALQWSENKDGDQVIALSQDQWDLVQSLDLCVYADDGSTWLNLGEDNIFDFDEDGNLLAPQDDTWLSINDRIISYFRISTTGDQSDYTITGRTPVMLNGRRANLILVFDSDHPEGYVAGASFAQDDAAAETFAKNLTELAPGDTIEFLCDGYDTDGNYLDTYTIGDEIVIDTDMSELEIANEDIGDWNYDAMYRFTDIYGQTYFTPLAE